MRVLVYGTLLAGLPNHHVLSALYPNRTPTLVGTGVTANAFRMYSLGFFPAITPGGDKGVHVECYEIPYGCEEQALRILDHLEGYRGPDDKRNLYRREKQVALINGQEISGWLYIWDDAQQLREMDKRFIPSRNWREHVGGA